VTSAAIFGCEGLTLSKRERDFFADVAPWGFILFKRNIDTPTQVKRLTDALRETVGRADAPILIDQEGGRVQRMGPPHWPVYPPGRAYSQVQRNWSGDADLARLGARLIAHDLAAVGINVDCVPVLDVPAADGHEIIGDRAYGADASTVSRFGRAAAEGLIAGGVLPVIKHIPGHGRAKADSHLALPVVETSYDELDAIDFAPFKALSDMPLAMTAHVVFTAIDAKRPVTTSREAISKVIRREIGFDGLLMSDDLSMKALAGDFTERAEAALKAGCDVVLHCNGDMAEMTAVAKGTGRLKGRAASRASAALARLPRQVEPLDIEDARARFKRAFA